MDALLVFRFLDGRTAHQLFVSSLWKSKVVRNPSTCGLEQDVNTIGLSSLANFNLLDSLKSFCWRHEYRHR
jgi:hypothetical protein